MNSDQNKNPLWVDGTANERVSERNANDYVWFEMERVHRTSSGPQRSVWFNEHTCEINIFGTVEKRLRDANLTQWA